MEDWNNVMNNKVLFQILNDKSTEKYIEIAFGKSVKMRKKWLSSGNI